MTAVIDTNVLLDILLEDPDHYKRSKKLLESHAHGLLVISPIVYSELLVQFLKKFDYKKAITELEQFLKDVGIIMKEFTNADFQLAAQVWKNWLAEKGNAVSCPQCGYENRFDCKKCHMHIRWRQHIITDFLIGAHAQRFAGTFLTRDRGFYKYFELKIE